MAIHLWISTCGLTERRPRLRALEVRAPLVSACRRTRDVGPLPTMRSGMKAPSWNPACCPSTGSESPPGFGSASSASGRAPRPRSRRPAPRAARHRRAREPRDQRPLHRPGSRLRRLRLVAARAGCRDGLPDGLRRREGARDGQRLRHRDDLRLLRDPARLSATGCCSGASWACSSCARS